MIDVPVAAFCCILTALATYRLAHMVALEEGPGLPWSDSPVGAFSRLRGALDPDQTTWVGRGVNCPYCVGFWVSCVLTLLLVGLGIVPFLFWPLTWWGVAGLATLFEGRR